MNTFLLKLAPYVLGAVGIMAAGWYLHHRWYAAGQAERTAYYAPLMDSIKREQAVSQARVKALETASQTISAQVEQRHVQNEQVLQARATAAERRIGSLLQDITVSGRYREMSGTPGPASEPGPTPEVAARLNRIAVRISGTGRSCEADSAQLAELQTFYNAQRQLQSASE